MSELGDAETKPTHRCPRCGGSSRLEEEDEEVRLQAALSYRRTRAKPCPVCTPYGPFGLVPEVIAIEAVLTAEVSPVEKEMRAQQAFAGHDELAARRQAG